MNDLQLLINESIQLMFIGMGSVFIILVLLIFLINLVTRVLTLLKLEDEPPPTRTAVGNTRKTPRKTDQELIAVISSAITAYKKRHPAQ